MSGIYCDILSGILSGIFADIHSGTLSGILSGRRAQLHPELAVGFGSRRALSHHELAEEEEGRRRKKKEEGRRRKKKEEERRKKKEEEGRRRKKKKEGGRRICTFVTIYIETLTWQVGNSTIPTNIYSEFIRLYLLLLQPISPTVLPYSHVFTAYQ